MDDVRMFHPRLKNQYRNVKADKVEAHEKAGWKREAHLPSQDQEPGSEPAVVDQEPLDGFDYGDEG